MLKTTACIASLVGALAFAVPAVAARGDSAGGPDRSSQIKLVVLGGAATPHYGDDVTFDVSTTATEHPFVNLKCHQSGALVGEGYEGFFDGALGDRIFALYSPQWTGGAADCTAALVMAVSGRWKQLATTSFHVEG